MAREVENTLRAAAEKIAAYVDDAAAMTVVTQYVHVAPAGDIDFASAKPIARTIIRLDGDSEAIIPMRQAEAEPGGFEIDAALLDVHERAVAAATEYRATMLRALIEALPARLR